MDPFLLTVLVVIFALIYDLTNGWNDSANAIATVVSTRVMRPATAVAFGASLDFIGALFSSEVARTIGQEVADPRTLTALTFLAATIIAPIWVTYCTLKGLPISCSHSLMGGLIGAVLATAGVSSVRGQGISKIAFGIFTSPIIGFLLAWVIMTLVYVLCRNWKPGTVTRWFGRLQIGSAGLMAFSHGTGDAQKAMGIITGCLVAGGYLALGKDGRLEIPWEVRIACAIAMCTGTSLGGWRVIKTLGGRLANLRPYHGFAAETAAATTILANTLTGVPISTTHSITGAILGVGAVGGWKRVRWAIGGKIAFAWVVTFPVCIGGGWAIYHVLHWLGA